MIEDGGARGRSIHSRWERCRRPIMAIAIAALAWPGPAADAASPAAAAPHRLVEISAGSPVAALESAGPVEIRVAPTPGEVRLGDVRAPEITVVGGGPSTTLVLAGSLVAEHRLRVEVAGDLVADREVLPAGGVRIDAGGTLSIAAAGSIRLGDAPGRPVVLSSGGPMELEGRQALDVSILADGSSRAVSGGDLVLRAGAPILGDARWMAGRNLRLETLDGRPADLVSPDDPIVLSIGDVSFGSYTGASLHILAGGSITATDITVTGTGSSATTVGPSNLATFNGADSFAALAAVTLSDSTAVAVDGAARPTVDLRAGVEWSTFAGGAPSPVYQEIPAGSVGTTFLPKTGAAITTANIFVTAPDGLVLLTNRYRPAGALSGGIQTLAIQTDAAAPGSDGGAVVVDSRGAVSLGSVSTASFQSGAGAAAGDGGPVRVLADGGLAVSSILTASFSQSATAGDGGDVMLRASGLLTGAPNVYSYAAGETGAGHAGSVTVDAAGPLQLGDLFAYARFDGAGSAGDGGDVTVTARALGPADGGETLTLGVVLADSGCTLATATATGPSGNGGTVDLATEDGDLTVLPRIWSRSTSCGGTHAPGNGGPVTLTAVNGGVEVGDLGIATSSRADAGSTASSGAGGAVTIAASHDVSVSAAGSGGVFTDSVSGGGAGGAGGPVAISAAGGVVDLGASPVDATAKASAGVAGAAGTIVITAHGDVTAGSLRASSTGEPGVTSGDAGDIAVQSSTGSVTLGALDAHVSAGGVGEAGDGGAVTVAAPAGAIEAGQVWTWSYASGTGTAGSGGSIELAAHTGIAVGTTSNVAAFASSSGGSAGDGGDVSIATGSGNLELFGVSASATAASGRAGSGGDITVATGAGRVDLVSGAGTTSLDTRASGRDSVGDGGSITVSATGGLGVTGTIRSNTLSTLDAPAGRAGDVALFTSGGDIVLLDVVAAGDGLAPSGGGSVALEAPAGAVTTAGVDTRCLGVTGCGSGGAIHVAAGGDLQLGGDLQSGCRHTGAGLAGDGGPITLVTAAGSIAAGTIDSRATASSAAGTAGDGGPISLSAPTGAIGAGEVLSWSLATGGGTAASAGSIELRAAADVEVARLEARAFGAAGAVAGGRIVVDSGGVVRITGGGGALPSVDATGPPGSGAVILAHGGGAGTPFTVGDPAVNGTAWTIACDGAVLSPTATYPASHHQPPRTWILAEEAAVLVNEIDVDQPGADDREFVELHNPFPVAMELGLVTLEIVDGTGVDPVVVSAVDLPHSQIPVDGHYVICPTGATTPGCDLSAAISLQDDGPAAVAVRLAGILQDTVSYEGDTPPPYTEGTGVGLEDPGIEPNRSLARTPDGADTDQNASDLDLVCVSPGLPNLAASTGCTASGGAVLTALAVVPPEVDEGSPVTVEGSFAEPPPGDAHTVEIDWGDGGMSDVPLSAGTTSFSADHAYADDSPAEAPWTIQITVTDGVSSDTALTSVEVRNVAPIVEAGPDRVTAVDVPIRLGGSFTDPGAADTHTVHWDFGDGTDAWGTLAPDHAWTDSGVHTVTLTVEDDDGGVGSDTLTVTVATAPVVTGTDTVAAIAGGLLSGARARGPVTTLAFHFNEPLLDPPGSTGTPDVTNPDHYRLVGAGADGVVSTLGCGAPAGDDTLLPLSAVDYRPSTGTAVIRPASADALADGRWRIILCASGLGDLDGEPLDGDRDGVGGDDWVADLEVLRDELLANPNFDLGLDGWSQVTPGGSPFVHDTVDGEASPYSGSSTATNAAGAGTVVELRQCVELPANPEGPLTLRALVRFAPGALDASFAGVELRFFDGFACGGARVGTSTGHPLWADTDGRFLQVAAHGRPPLAAVSVEAVLLAEADPAAPSPFTAHFDRASLAFDDPVFDDGFEAGDTTSWSAAVP